MTRINLIPPQALADQHLIAECAKEINQLQGSLRRSLNSKKGFSIDDIPTLFTLNTGHVKFFYDKNLYLHKRFNELKRECLERGFKVEVEFNNVCKTYSKQDLYKDYIPDKEAVNLVIDRIQSRVLTDPKSSKPDYWYKFNKIPISNLEYVKRLETYRIK